MRAPGFIFSAAVLLAGCSALDEELGPDALAELDRAASAYPPDAQRGYALFRKRCAECHSLAKSLGARAQGGRWRLVARRMARKPASGIREEEIDPIAAFLERHLARN